MIHNDQRGKLIVVNETILAVEFPENPGVAQVLGINKWRENCLVRNGDVMSIQDKARRLASEEDFNNFKMVFSPIGFGNPKKYVFQTN